MSSTSSSSSSILGKRRRSVSMDHSVMVGDCMWMVFAYLTSIEISRTVCKVSTSWKQAAVHPSLWRDVICEKDWDEQETTDHFNWCRRNGVKLYHVNYSYFYITPIFLCVAASSLRSLSIHSILTGGESNFDLRIFTSLEHASLRYRFLSKYQYRLPDSVRTLVLFLNEHSEARLFMQVNKHMLHHIQVLHVDINIKVAIANNALPTFAGICPGVHSLVVSLQQSTTTLRYKMMNEMCLSLCPNATTIVMKNGVYNIKQLSISNPKIQHLMLIECETQCMRSEYDAFNAGMMLPNLKTLLYEHDYDRYTFDSFSCTWINRTVLPNLELLLYHRPDSLLQQHHKDSMITRLSNTAPDVLLCIQLIKSELVTHHKQGNIQDTSTHDCVANWLKPTTEEVGMLSVDFVGLAAHLFPALNTITAKFAALDKYLTRQPTLSKHKKVDV